MDIEIPKEIREQEREIESIFRSQFEDGRRFIESQRGADDWGKGEAAALTLFVVCGLLLIFNFYLLALRATGGCGPFGVLCRNPPAALTEMITDPQ